MSKFDKVTTVKLDGDIQEKLQQLEDYYTEYFKVLNPRSSIIRRGIEELHDKLIGDKEKQPA